MKTLALQVPQALVLKRKHLRCKSLRVQQIKSSPSGLTHKRSAEYVAREFLFAVL